MRSVERTPTRVRRPSTRAAAADLLSCLAVYGTLTPHSVLVGLDGTRASMRAADYALGHAMRARRGVIGVYVRSVASPDDFFLGIAPQVDCVHDDIAEEVYQYLESRSRELGVAAALVDVYGAPVRELRRMAVALAPDVLIVGSSGRAGRLKRAVGPALARGARQPVIIVP